MCRASRCAAAASLADQTLTARTWRAMPALGYMTGMQSLPTYSSYALHHHCQYRYAYIRIHYMVMAYKDMACIDLVCRVISYLVIADKTLTASH